MSNRRRGSGQLVLSEVEPEAALTPGGFEQVLRATLEDEIRVFPARAWWPSMVAHACDRHVVWRWTRWESQERYGPVLQSIFDQGDDIQPVVVERLKQMGFDVLGEDDRPVQYRAGTALISGKPDGRLLGFRGARFRPSPVLEIKSMNGYQWEQLHTAEDLRTSDNPTHRGYYGQGQLYCFLENVQRGFFVLYSKDTGMLKLIPYELDYAYAEALLARAERLQPLIDARVDPPPIPFDRSVCGRCSFKGQCYPPKSFGEGAAYLDNPALVALLERREQLAPSHGEYTRVDKDVKDTLKHEGVKFALIGPFTVEGKQASDGSIRYAVTRGAAA